MSSHGNHRKRINSSNEINNKKSSIDFISIMTNLLANIKPEDISALLTSFKLGNSKTVNQNDVIQDGEIIYNPSQTEGQNNYRNNAIPDFSGILKSLVSFVGSQDMSKMLQMFSAGNIIKR